MEGIGLYYNGVRDIAIATTDDSITVGIRTTAGRWHDADP